MPLPILMCYCAHPHTLPGARRLLRWEQALFFHASAATEPHPEERKVVLRVHAGELAEEVGLTSAAVKHMLRVAGVKHEGGRCDPNLLVDSIIKMYVLAALGARVVWPSRGLTCAKALRQSVLNLLATL